MKPVLLALTALAILLAVVAPGFYSPGNLRELALNNVAALLAAVAVTLVILCGEIDISIGSQLAVCSVIVGELARAGVPAWGLLPIAAAAGAGLGAVNGVLVSGWRIPSIVATLVLGALILIFTLGLAPWVPAVSCVLAAAIAGPPGKARGAPTPEPLEKNAKA